MCNSSGCGPQGPRGCSEGAEWGAGSWPLRKTQLQPVRNRPFQPPRSGPCPLPGCQGRGQVGGIPVWQGRAHVRPPPCSHPLVIAGQVSPTIRQVSPPSTSHPKYKRGAGLRPALFTGVLLPPREQKRQRHGPVASPVGGGKSARIGRGKTHWPGLSLQRRRPPPGAWPVQTWGPG